MNGLAEETNLDFLFGKKLTQVAIGKHQLVFAFEGDLSLVVEGKLSYQITDVELEDLPQEGEDGFEEIEDLVDSEEWPEDAFSQSTRIHWLLDNEITEYEIDPEGHLYLTFSNTDQLTLFDSNPDTESYQLIAPNQHIVV